MKIPVYDKTIRKFLLHHITKSSRVIDVGYGIGRTTLLLSPQKRTAELAALILTR